MEKPAGKRRVVTLAVQIQADPCCYYSMFSPNILGSSTFQLDNFSLLCLTH